MHLHRGEGAGDVHCARLCMQRYRGQADGVGGKCDHKSSWLLAVDSAPVVRSLRPDSSRQSLQKA